MRLVGEVDDAADTTARLARRHQRHERGHRAAAHEQPLRPVRHPAPRAQPVDHRELDRRRARGGDPRRPQQVEARRDRVGERRDVVRRRADAGEEARVDRARRPRQHLVEQPVQGGVRIAGRLGRRPTQSRTQRRGLPHDHRRLGIERLQVVHDAVDHPVAEAAHLLGRELQRRGHRQIVTDRCVVSRMNPRQRALLIAVLSRRRRPHARRRRGPRPPRPP